MRCTFILANVNGTPRNALGDNELGRTNSRDDVGSVVTPPSRTTTGSNVNIDAVVYNTTDSLMDT